LGWPTFNADGKYEGPLGPKPETTESLTGKSGRDFATARSAAWPPELCHRIAHDTFQEFSAATPEDRAEDKGAAKTEDKKDKDDNEPQDEQEEKDKSKDREMLVDEVLAERAPPRAPKRLQNDFELVGGFAPR